MLDIFFNFRYSFEYGMVTVIQVSTEHNYTTDSDQLNWFKDTLENVDRTKTPW